MKRIFTYLLLTLTAVACHMEMPHKPVARFTYSPEGGCTAPCRITFNSISENAESLLWDFGDNLEHTKQTEEFIFATPGSYKVRLTAKGVDGGSSGSTQTVHIDNIAPFRMTGGYNFPTDIVSDDNNNIYISGTASGTVQFGNGFELKSKGGEDFFVAKFDSTGKCLWLYADGSTGDDHCNAITLDKQNNVYLTGFVGGKVTTWNNVFRGNVDGFITKLDDQGKFSWARTFGGPHEDQGRSIAFYHAGEGAKIYLIGRVQGDLQTKNIDFNRTSFQMADGHDGFFALVDAEKGEFGDPKMISGPNVQIPETITVDAQGNAYIAGGFRESITFPSPIQPFKSVNEVDAFVLKWSPITGFLWASRAGSGGDDFAYDVVADASGNVFVTGMHSGTLEEFPLPSKGDENVYLLKWNSEGKIQNGVNGFIDYIKDYHAGIALTPTGNIVLSGSFTNAAQFPMGKGNSVSSLGSTDILITELDPVNLQHASDFFAKAGGILEDRVNKICVTKSGYVYATGWFFGSPVYKGVMLKGQEVRNTFVVRYKL